jgi:hypothetical protein
MSLAARPTRTLLEWVCIHTLVTSLLTSSTADAPSAMRRRRVSWRSRRARRSRRSRRSRGRSRGSGSRGSGSRGSGSRGSGSS